jgi:hypothetical protein
MSLKVRRDSKASRKATWAFSTSHLPAFTWATGTARVVEEDADVMPLDLEARRMRDQNPPFLAYRKIYFEES